jgi:uncharacterized protein YdeI (BOF family)
MNALTDRIRVFSTLTAMGLAMCLVALPGCAEPESPPEVTPVADAPPSGAAAPAGDVTNIADVRPGASVRLQGTVTRILDEDEFRIEDETGSIRVYIGWRNRVPVEVGERVRVRGIVDDDLVGAFRPEVYADEIVRADGTVIPLDLTSD